MSPITVNLLRSSQKCNRRAFLHRHNITKKCAGIMEINLFSGW